MSVIYTIGYEGTDIDSFIATLGAAGIMALADIRAIANSRKRGFSKSALKERIESEGISYTHFIQLGDPKPGRDAARAGRIDEFRSIYNSHLGGPEQQSALVSLSELACSVPTCLLCFERDPEICHRTIVANQLSALGLELLHLFGDDPGRYVRNAKHLPRFYPRKGAAAA